MPRPVDAAAMAQDDSVTGMQEHYAAHLAPIYTWMVGDVDAALERSRELLSKAGILGGPAAGIGKRAIDLGCGFGLQSLPLAEAGYAVVGIDLSADLLAELECRRGSRAILTVLADLRNFPAHVATPVDVIACLGDTLTHLPDRESVDDLLGAMSRALVPGGKMLLGFRDFHSVELKGVDRIIPVRSDADRILTCLLEYETGRVAVTDLIHECTPSGWQQRASRYWKLRLDPDQVVQRIESVGLTLERKSVERGMVTLVACRKQ